MIAQLLAALALTMALAAGLGACLRTFERHAPRQPRPGSPGPTTGRTPPTDR